MRGTSGSRSRRRLVLSVAAVVGAGGLALGWRVARVQVITTRPADRVARSTASIHTLRFDHLTRQYLEMTPDRPVSPSIPILVVLHGRRVTPEQEARRDGFLALASQGRAELVYPAGIGRSWNAGGCCGLAAAEHVDDAGFLTDLIARVDPGDRRPVYLVGFSNGGRLAYTLACDDPGLVDGYAVVDAVPVHPCTAPRPITVVQVDGTADPLVPYRPGDHGAESPPATIQVARLRAIDGCVPQPTTSHAGELTLSTWTSCHSGTRVGFASYAGVGHLWPPGDATTPGAAAVIWSFLTGTAA
jgi:polyhydroxybutyrate depolymerase